jgi:hypothetical protein
LIGIGAIAGAAWQAWQWETLMSENAPAPPIAERIAHSMVFVCFGLSLLVPVRWLSRARVLPLLVAGAVLWFAPCLLPGDHPYGFLLRMFATSVGIVALLLWRTLFDLTRPAAASVST